MGVLQDRRRARRTLGSSLRRTTLVALLPALALAAGGWFWARPHERAVIKAFVDPQVLLVIAVGVVVAWLLWVGVICLTYALTRPRPATSSQRLRGLATVAVLCALVTAPAAVGVRYSLVQRDLVTSLFGGNKPTGPGAPNAADPWEGRRRVNVLLLGGDGKVGRPGVRTDSVILASIDTRTGRTTLFSLPRNLARVPFAPGSPLAAVYPDGFTGPGDAAEFFLNAVYQNVPIAHPGILGPTGNEGAGAVKSAVSGALGVPVDYYVLVNLQGFSRIVEAIGGITVNIDEPIPIGGNTDAGIKPDGYLTPGPNRRLDGFEALWFARGRYGLNDYKRMDRQRCAMKAILDEADPLTLLRRYTALASAGKKILRTDIPQALLPSFVDLGLTMKGAPLRSVVFKLSPAFDPNDPDYRFVKQAVARALLPPSRTPSAAPSPSASPSSGATSAPDDNGASTDTTDDCAYRPVAASGG